MNLAYYTKTFGKDFPRHIKSVSISAKELMKANGSWNDLEYIASYVRGEFTFYFTFSKSITTSFYSDDKIETKKYINYFNYYVSHENTTAILGIRFLENNDITLKCIEYFKSLTLKFTDEEILDAIKKVEEKWPQLTRIR